MNESSIPSSDFLIEYADYAHDLDALRAVREPVFIIEQNVPESMEWDELDPLSQHVLARSFDGQPIGTARLTPERKIGRMAVLADWRGRGVGAALLQTLIERAQALRYDAVSLHAQVSAIGFYQRYGFVPYGEEFDEAGIRHRAMRRDLPPLATRPPQALEETPDRELLDGDNLHSLRAGSLKLIGQARRRLWIYSRDLDPLLYGSVDALDALKDLALRADEQGIRILIQQPAVARESMHPLIPLAQRLSTAFSLRQPVDDTDLQFAGAFLLNDRGGYLSRPLASNLDATGSTWAPARSQPLQDYFERVWERAQPCTELRALQL